MPMDTAFCKPSVSGASGDSAGRECKFIAILGFNSSKDELLLSPGWQGHGLIEPSVRYSWAKTLTFTWPPYAPTLTGKP